MKILNSYSLKKMAFLAVLFFPMLTMAQPFEKPRYFKFDTPLAPVDITKQLTEEGLIKGNKDILRIDTFQVSKIASATMANGNIKIQKNDKYMTDAYDTIILKSILIGKGKAFDVVQAIGSFSLIKLWSIGEGKGSSIFDIMKEKAGSTIGDLSAISKIKGLTGSYNGGTVDLTKDYYLVPTKTLLANSVEFDNKYGQWNLGILAMPVKIRPFATESGQFDFTDGFSIGTALSYNLTHNWIKDKTGSVLVYMGLSSFTADSSKIKEKRDDYKITSFSPAIGYMVEKKGIQVSLLAGIDLPAGKVQKVWVYRYMPWFSIGLGFSLFKISDNESAKPGKNKPE